jgi:hypothetical protein
LEEICLVHFLTYIRLQIKTNTNHARHDKAVGYCVLDLSVILDIHTCSNPACSRKNVSYAVKIQSVYVDNFLSHFYCQNFDISLMNINACLLMNI